MTDHALDRRSFLGVCCGGGALALLAGCAAVAATPVPVAGGRIRLALADHPALRTPGGGVCVAPIGRRDPVVVIAMEDGNFSALSPICTHRGCTVDLQGDRLVCPCHGSTYDRAGVVLRGPAERPLFRYQAVRDGDVVDVLLGDGAAA
jgi:cytochrome b6-f complex iron-sulfur subunit